MRDEFPGLHVERKGIGDKLRDFKCRQGHFMICSRLCTACLVDDDLLKTPSLSCHSRESGNPWGTQLDSRLRGNDNNTRRQIGSEPCVCLICQQ